MSRTLRSRAGVRDPELTLGGRCAAAFGSLLFSVPAIGLLWLLFNSQLLLLSDMSIPASYLGGGVIAFALFAFAFPKLAPALLGKLWELLLGLGKHW